MIKLTLEIYKDMNGMYHAAVLDETGVIYTCMYLNRYEKVMTGNFINYINDTLNRILSELYKQYRYDFEYLGWLANNYYEIKNMPGCQLLFVVTSSVDLEYEVGSACFAWTGNARD